MLSVMMTSSVVYHPKRVQAEVAFCCGDSRQNHRCSAGAPTGEIFSPHMPDVRLPDFCIIASFVFRVSQDGLFKLPAGHNESNASYT